MTAFLNFIAAFLQLNPEAQIVVFGLMGPLLLWFSWQFWQFWLFIRREQGYFLLLQREVQGHWQNSSPDEPLERDQLTALTAMPTNANLARSTEAVLRLSRLATPDVSAALRAIWGEDDPRLGIIRPIPNLLMLIGLLGTILGLAATVGSLGPQVQQSASASGPEQLAKALGATLGTMQAAFGASLWGIVLSAISSLLLGLASSVRSRLFGTLEAFVLSELVPAVFPRASEAQFERQMKLIKATANIFGNFDATMKESIKQFDTMMQKSGMAIVQNLDDLEKITNEMRGTLGQITQGVGSLGQKLADSAEILARSQDITAKTFAELQSKLEVQINGQVQNLNTLQSSLSSSNNSILAEVAKVATRLDNTVAKFQEGSNQMQLENSSLRGVLEQQFRQLQELLAKQSSENAGLRNDLVQQLGQLQLNLGRQVNATAQVMDEVKAQLVLSQQATQQLSQHVSQQRSDQNNGGG
jgi:hypothetical protein